MEDRTSSRFVAGSPSLCLRRKSAKEIWTNLSGGALAVALLADALVKQRLICCFVGFEMTLMNSISPCKFSVDFSGKLGIEKDHMQSLGLMESWRVMAKLSRLVFAIPDDGPSIH